MTETINSRFFLLVTGKSIAEKPHNRINFQDMQLVSSRAVFVSILIFVRSGAGVRRDQSRHLVFMKTIRQSGKLTRDRNQFSRNVNGREFFFIFQWILYANFTVYYEVLGPIKRVCTCCDVTITDEGKEWGFNLLLFKDFACN